MNEPKRLYETTFIVNAALEDPQIEAVVGRIQDVITKNDNEIVAVNKWGRKRLAYPIKRKYNGYYVNIEFNGNGSTVKQLQHVYNLDENILRHLTIRVDKKALKAREMPSAVIEDDIISEIELVDLKEPLFTDDDSTEL